MVMLLCGGIIGNICSRGEDFDDIDFVGDGGIEDPKGLGNFLNEIISVGLNDPPYFQELYAI